MRLTLVLLAAATLLPAQTFEVASVKVNTSGTGMRRISAFRNGHFSTTNITMRQILEEAWNLSSVQITGPSWIDSDRYDLDARSSTTVPDTALQPMLQALLRDRFHLEAHVETKELPVYNLVVAKGGPKIHPPDPDHPFHHHAHIPGATGMMTSVKGTMEQLAAGLALPAGRTVLNKTGLDGPYAYSLQYGQLNTSSDPNGAPDIFAALDQQLGLKLEPAKAPISVLVVDRADRVPTGN